MTEENPFAGQGSVLLDIGGDVGALVVRMPTSMRDEEVEIRLVGSEDHPHEAATSEGHDHGHAHGGHSHRPHVAVVDRPVHDGVVASLVFPELVEGSYELLPKGTDDVRLCVEIRGGAVTQAEWPT